MPSHPTTPRHAFLQFLLATTLLLFTTTWAAAAEPQIETRTGQPCYILRNKNIDLAITQLGGHMAPVNFYADTPQPVQPYYISPWQEEQRQHPVPVLVPLRGDFFCLPFGANSEAYRGEKHPPHGEVAGSKWTYVSTERQGSLTTLSLSLATQVRPGKVTKKLSIVEGQNVVYSQHIIEGFIGQTPVAHHATLRVPEKEGSLRVAVSPFQFGMTNPVLFSDPTKREYQSLAIAAKFDDLRKIPVLAKNQPDADGTSFPARTGFADLIAVFNDIPRILDTPAWVTATVADEGYLWFSLKDPRILPSTIFWIENRGRHGAPWDGRNRCLGLEDACSYFAEGIVPSTQPNLLTNQGIPTAISLTQDKPTAINYIQGTVKIPADFGTVDTLEFTPGQVTFISTTGKKVSTPVQHQFVRSGKLSD